MRKVLVCLIALSAVASAQGWKKIFDGTSLNGWKHVGPGDLVLENGVMVTSGGMGLLWYELERFGNTTVRVVFKTDGARGNSGVYIRMPEAPHDPWYGVHNGYEVQIEAGGDDWHCTGAIYSLSKAAKRVQKPAGEWNTMDIELKGLITTVYVNGEKVNEFDPSKPVPERVKWYEPIRGPRAEMGYIGIQNHDGASKVSFKEISVKR